MCVCVYVCVCVCERERGRETKETKEKRETERVKSYQYIKNTSNHYPYLVFISSNEGSTFSTPSISPTLTHPIGPFQGCLESISAREAALTAAIEGS